MAELKTKLTDASADAFIDAIPDAQVREDCRAIAAIMAKATGAPPRMWGTNIIGFGSYTYKYASGRTGDWPRTAFAPRKTNITLYIMAGFEQYDELLAKLGKHSIGKSCLYIKRLSDVHVPTLKKLVEASVKHMNKIYPPGAAA